MLKQKIELGKVLSNFGKLKANYESGFSSMTLSFDKNVEVLTSKIASNKASAEVIGSKVDSIFKAAHAQLQLLESVATPKQ